jgi:hypothetical protein
MSAFSKILVGAGVVAGIVGAGILIGWLGSRGTAPPPRSTTPPLAAVEPAPPPPAPAANPLPAPARTNPETLAASTAPAAGAADLVTNWDDKVDQILGADTDDTNKVAQLFALFPHLPEEGQVEVAEHLSNLVPDDNYAPLGGLLENAKLPESVLDELMADVLNRPNALKLPVLLQVAQEPDNPKAGEAKDLLELYLDEDYGSDWNLWQQKLQDWLKANPD